MANLSSTSAPAHRFGGGDPPFLARRSVLRAGLQGILTVSVAPAIIRIEALMRIGPLSLTSEGLASQFPIVAVRPTRSAGQIESMYKFFMIQNARRLEPRSAAIVALRDLIKRGAAEINTIPTPWEGHRP